MGWESAGRNTRGRWPTRGPRRAYPEWLGAQRATTRPVSLRRLKSVSRGPQAVRNETLRSLLQPCVRWTSLTQVAQARWTSVLKRHRMVLPDTAGVQAPAPLGRLSVVPTPLEGGQRRGVRKDAARVIGQLAPQAGHRHARGVDQPDQGHHVKDRTPPTVSCSTATPIESRSESE